MNVEGPAYLAHQRSRVEEALEDELTNGPDARPFPCPSCAGGADGEVTFSRVNEVYAWECDGCNLSGEIKS